MSHLEMQLLAYERVSNINPFDGEPKSGSGWSMEELQWLQVDARTHVSPHILLGLPDSADDGDYLQEYYYEGHSQDTRIKAWLGVGWDEVKQGKYDNSVKTFYGELKNLCSRPVDVFASSPPLPASVSSGNSKSDVPTSTTPTPSRKRALTPVSATPKKMIRASPCTDPGLSATRPLQPSYLSSPYLPRIPTAAGVQIAAHLVNESTPSFYPSDSTYIPSTPACISSTVGSSTCDKNEDDVVALARSFLYLLQDFSRDEVGSIERCTPSVSAAPRLSCVVDGALISAEADVSLCLNHRRPRWVFELPVECKRLQHGLTEHDIRGQEICHLVAGAQKYRNVFSDCDTYEVFLLSWHHLQAYISRATVSRHYLETLATESEKLDERLSVVTCIPFNVKLPEDRIHLMRVLLAIVSKQMDTLLGPTTGTPSRTRTAKIASGGRQLQAKDSSPRAK